MSVLRQHTVLLDVVEPATGPLVGAAHRFTPSDGDGIADSSHEFVALVRLHRGLDPTPATALTAAPGTVPPPPPEPEAETSGPSLLLSIEGSFGEDRWVRIAGASLGARDRNLEKVLPLGPIPPILRVRVMSPRGLAFTFTAYAAVGSSAPYRSRTLP